jgi:ectoine hydroxylase-related dioxygenase (phytanoyl-CoA dioxygenase family)
MNTKAIVGGSLDPKVLTTDQVCAYHADGYLILRNVFPRAQVSRLGDEGDRIAREHRDLIDQMNMRVRFKTHVHTGELVFEVFDPIADLSPVARDVAHNRRLFDILHDIYGEPAELFKEKLIYKPPGATGATLHQDWIGWPGFPESFLTVLVAIDPFTLENGATEVYPGVHKNGYLSPKDGQHHYLSADVLGVDPVPLLLEPGDIAIFGCFTPHRSEPNRTESSRRGYFISFNAQSDGGDQYASHYREFHDWIRAKSSAETRDQLFFR